MNGYAVLSLAVVVCNAFGIPDCIDSLDQNGFGFVDNTFPTLFDHLNAQTK